MQENTMQQATTTTMKPDSGAPLGSSGAGRQPGGQQLIGAIDQGTSSTRFLVFENGSGRLIASSQTEIKRIVPKEGWVEIDPNVIMDSVYETIGRVHEQLPEELAARIECIGICNQRESTVVWDSKTGKALYNVIVWMDNRTKNLVDQLIDSVPGRDFNWLKDKTGLPMSTYFSAFKLKWLIDNVEEVQVALKERRLMFGTVDSWILWNLTGKHLTDVTNASRTFLMDIETLEWDKSLCDHFGVPLNILPKILASADDFGQIQHGPLKGLPITGVIGDQSAALFGHNCLQLGQTKATFGTGCFIMQNIGPGPLNGAMSGIQREAKRGLITTVGFKLRDRPACYALEGSVKIAGAAITWLRDNMQLIKDYDECDQLVNQTSHTAGVFFVPAFGGLYSPYWDPNASGLYIGLSQFTRREHLVRATFDSIAFQTNDILSLMRGVANCLMIDGGLCKSDNMCQILADITGIDIVRPSMCETSALGAAMVAGCGANIWSYDKMLANSNTTSYEYSSSSNQNTHYPQESLYYDDKFSSLIHANSFPSNNSDTSTNKPVPRQTPPSARLSIEHGSDQNRNLDIANRTSACNLDAGGGVNDDAGGGPRAQDVGLQDSNAVDEEDRDTTSSQIAGSDDTSDTTEDETGATNSGEFGAHAGTSTNDDLVRGVIVEGSGVGDNLSTIIGTTTSSVSTQFLVTNSHDSSNFYETPSSGYNSADNFEQTTTNSAAGSFLDQMRRDSPVSSSQDVVESSTADQLWLTLANQGVDRVEQATRRMSNASQNKAQHKCDSEANRATGSQLTPQTFHPFNGLSSCIRNYICLHAPTATVATSDRPRHHGSDLNLNELSDEEQDNDSNNENDERFEQHPSHGEDSSDPQESTQPRMMTKPVDVFQSYISLEHRTELVATWRLAVERSMKWTKIHHEEVRRIDYQRLSSLPISMYLFFSIGMVALSGILSAGRGFAPNQL